GVRHGQQCQSEGECHAEEADADLRESGRNHRAPATSQHQPKGSKQLRCRSICDRHHILLVECWASPSAFTRAARTCSAGTASLSGARLKCSTDTLSWWVRLPARAFW